MRPERRSEINRIVHLMSTLDRVFAPQLMARVVSSSARRVMARVRQGPPSHPPVPS
jgi:hypothetical protein